MEWTKIFAVNTSRTLPAGEADIWYKELCEEVQGFKQRADRINDDEIAAAIRWAYSDKYPGSLPQNKFDITKNVLRKWIQAYRGHNRCNPDGSGKAAAQRARNIDLFNSLKEQIKNETDPCKIWDLICTPSVQDGFKDKVYSILECWAFDCHPEWRRPEEYIASKWKPVHEGMKAVSEHMKDDPSREKDPRYRLGSTGRRHR